jgi:hypothetical protein
MKQAVNRIFANHADTVEKAISKRELWFMMENGSQKERLEQQNRSNRGGEQNYLLEKYEEVDARISNVQYIVRRKVETGKRDLPDGLRLESVKTTYMTYQDGKEVRTKKLVKLDNRQGNPWEPY